MIDKPHERPSSDASSRPPADPVRRIAKAYEIVRRNTYWTLGAGLVPIPVIDFVVVGAVQVKLLRELSSFYGVEFSEDLAQKAVATLLNSAGSTALGMGVGATIAKFVPVVGTLAGSISVAAFAAAFTNAIGKIFVLHFESGGTLLNFDPEAMRAHFDAEFEREWRLEAERARAQRETLRARFWRRLGFGPRARSSHGD